MKNSLPKKTFVVLIIAFTCLSSYASAIFEPCPPLFSQLSGRYNTDLQIQLTIWEGGTGLNIYYTTDGSTPTIASQLYTGNISIAGHGTQMTIKAINVDESNQISPVSSSTYIIDYNYDPNADYLTDLTWEEYNQFLVGEWFGYTTNPWSSNDYSVKLRIFPNGSYIDETTTTTIFGSGEFAQCEFKQTFYYGRNDPHPFKKIELNDILASGYATGYITIVYYSYCAGVNCTTTDNLRYVRFIDENNLYLEMWKSNQYGPLKYYLTKTTGSNLSTNEFNKSLVSVYPNPASNFLTIKNLNSNVKFINMLGQSYTLDKSERISVNHLPRGFYIIQFTDTSGAIIKHKIILN